MELNAQLSWPTPLLSIKYPDHERIKPALVEQCYAMERRAAAPIESGVTPQKKNNLYESKFDFFKKTDVPEIQTLREFCATALSRAIFRLFQQFNPGQPVPNRVGVDLHESWVHITRDGGFHEIHYHPNCSWCGIYYLERGECTLNPPNGVNRFFSPVMIGYEDFGSLAFRHTPVTMPPDEGSLVLFPSYIQHSAIPYRGQRDRIVISFNARVIPGQQ
jgi:uncharacterized protein (TIGR02466 family)